MVKHSLVDSISVHGAERFLAALSGAPEYVKPLEIDLSRASDISIGAGPRIGNALRRYGPLGLTVVIPHLDSRPLSRYLSDHWALFARSGLGLAIARHASLIRSAEADVTAEFKLYFDQSQFSQNLVTINNIVSPATINISDPNAFSAQLKGYFPKLNVHQGAFDEDALTPVIELCREAIGNVRDHAFKKPLGRDTVGLSYFSLRYHRKLARPEDEFDPLAPYIRRLNKNESEVAAKTTGFLEFVVNDDGVGIAGRQSQDAEVYWRSRTVEEKALFEALQAGGTIKPVALDSIMQGDPGYGFSKIAESLKALQGFASLRTGRFLAVFDGTIERTVSPDFSIVRSQFGNLNYLPGVLFQAVLPIRSPQALLVLR